MTTTELIKLLKKYEFGGATGRPREVMFQIGDEIVETGNIEVVGAGDGLVTELFLSLPSAQSEQRWIPCSERLPENDDSVLATTAWGDVTIAERVYPPINDTCWFIHDGNTNATIDDVVAWMPLPEPYTEGE